MSGEKSNEHSIPGPYGPIRTRDLPPEGCQRWVVRRKAVVVAAVRGGLLELNEALKRYNLTIDEFIAWGMAIDRHGLAGLRTTRVQEYRHRLPEGALPPRN